MKKSTLFRLTCNSGDGAYQCQVLNGGFGSDQMPSVWDIAVS